MATDHRDEEPEFQWFEDFGIMLFKLMVTTFGAIVDRLRSWTEEAPSGDQE